MVVGTLEPLDPNRKAWRLVRRCPCRRMVSSLGRCATSEHPHHSAALQVGGVLVERTCGEVLPAVKESLKQVAGRAWRSCVVICSVGADRVGGDEAHRVARAEGEGARRIYGKI